MGFAFLISKKSIFTNKIIKMGLHALELIVRILNGIFLFCHCVFKNYFTIEYGRTCTDIGCAHNEECVLKEEPCSRTAKQKNCGTYPACQRISNQPQTCSTFVCPPTQECQIKNGVPRCVAQVTSRRHKRLVQNNNVNNSSHYAPSAPPSPVNSNYPVYPNNNGYYSQGSQNSGLYPRLPSGDAAYGQSTRPPNIYQNGQNAYYPSQTTSRQNVAQQNIYQGGYPSFSNYGHPGNQLPANQNNMYYPYTTPIPLNAGSNQGNPSYYNTPRSNSQSYPNQPSYPNQGYPTQRYPNQGYSAQGYPNQGYPTQNYPNQRNPYQSNPNQIYPTQGYQNPYQPYPAPANPRYPTQQGQYPTQGRDSSYQQNYYNQNMNRNPPQSESFWDKVKRRGSKFLKDNFNISV